MAELGRGAGDRPAGETEITRVTLEPDWVDGSDPVDPEAARALPVGVCRHFGMIPVAFEEDVLTIAVADPHDLLAQGVARALAHENLNVVAAPEDEIHRAIDRVYAGIDNERPHEPIEPLPESIARAGRLGAMLVSRELVTED